VKYKETVKKQTEREEERAYVHLNTIKSSIHSKLVIFKLQTNSI